MCLVDKYKTLEFEPHEKVIIINDYSIPSNGTMEEFTRHPAVKELIEKLGKCRIHFGLVQYQS